MEAGAEAKTTEERCLLACSSQSVQPRHAPRGSTAHSGLGLPTSIINQENIPQTYLQTI